MFCPAGEQFESMGQYRKGGAQGIDGAFRAAGKVENDGGAACSAEAAAEDCQGRVAAAFGAHQLGNAFEHPVTDGPGGFRGDVAGADAGTARGHDEAGGAGGGPDGGQDRILDRNLFVWNYNRLSGFEPDSAQLSSDGGAGNVLPRSTGAGVAHGDDGGRPALCILHLLSHDSIVQTAVEAPN